MEGLTVWIVDALVLLGLVMVTVAFWGLFRLPDLYTRLHAASKALVLGIMPLLLALTLSGDMAIVSRAILIFVFVLLTTPVSSHALARASHLLDQKAREPVDEVTGGVVGDSPGRGVPS